tara:strand:+ start:758 stop:1273 length:516 start_codon:yes stop_codon:yes gene_type:complete
MSNLQIIIAPDPRLLKNCVPVIDIDKNVQTLLEEMLKTMYKSNGIGLAAPQVGVLKRLIVMDCSSNNKNTKPYKFINPEIVEFSSDKMQYEEGCLSLPTQFANVTRPNKIVVKYKNEYGELKEKNFDGLEAICLQHEIDHLNGKLFVDHISKLKRNRIINKLKKYKKQKGR